MADQGQTRRPARKPEPTGQNRPVRETYNIEQMKAAGVAAMSGFLFATSQYKRSLCIFILNILVFGIMAYQTYFITNYKPPVKYIPIYADSTIIEPTPLTQPFKNDAEISQWIADSAKDIFSYGYLTAESHGEGIKKYFTPKGFRDYFEKFSTSPDLSRVKNKKLEVLASVIGSPSKMHQDFKISGSGPNAFAYWEYKFTIRQIFVSTTEGVIPVTYDMVATIVRQDQRLYRDGIAIHSLRVESSSNVR